MVGDVDEVLVAAFAAAVLHPLEPGGLEIRHDNGPGGPGSIADLVRAGVAFAVKPTDRLICLDIDSEEARGWAGDARAWLRTRGCEFVRVASGRPGHEHLWVVMPRGWDPEHARVALKSALGAAPNRVLRAGQLVRPPLSPHRSGHGRAEVIEPSVDLALRLFRSAQPRQEHRRRDPRAWLAATEVPRAAEGRVDRGTLAFKIAVSARNWNWPYAWFLETVRSIPEVAEKFRAMPGGRGKAELHRKWQEAGEFVRTHPPVASSPEHVKWLEELRRADAGSWTPQQRLVFGALLDTAEACGKRVISASQRQLADATGVSRRGVATALKGLADAGAILQRPPKAPTQPGRVVLLPPRAGDELTPSFPNSPSLGGRGLMALVGAKAGVGTVLLQDIFMGKGGLGASVWETWASLPAEPTKLADLMALIPSASITRRTVGRHLTTLKHAGLVTREGHTWSRLDLDEAALRRIARRRGTDGRHERVALLHLAESARFSVESATYSRSSAARPA